eukprot:313601_1
MLTELPEDILYSICVFLQLPTLIAMELTCKILNKVASDPVHIKSFTLVDYDIFRILGLNRPIPFSKRTADQLLLLWVKYYVEAIKQQDKDHTPRFRLSEIKTLNVLGGRMAATKYFYPQMRSLESIYIATNGFENFQYFTELPNMKSVKIQSLPCNYSPMTFIKLKLTNLQKLLHLEVNEIKINHNSDIDALSKLTNLHELQVGKFAFGEEITVNSWRECILFWVNLKHVKLFEWCANQFDVISGFTSHPLDYCLLETLIHNNINLEKLNLFMPPKSRYNLCKLWECNKANIYSLKTFEAVLCENSPNYDYYVEIFKRLCFVNSLEHIKIFWNYCDEPEIDNKQFAELLCSGIVAIIHEEVIDETIVDNNSCNGLESIDDNFNDDNEETCVYCYGSVELYHFPTEIIRYLVDESFWKYECMSQLKRYRDEGIILDTMLLTMEEHIVCHDYMQLREKAYVENICIQSPVNYNSKNTAMTMLANGFAYAQVKENNKTYSKYNSITKIEDLESLQIWKSMTYDNA